MTKRTAHWLIAKTARDMAEELYEEYAQDNRFYAATHRQQGKAAFIRRETQNLLEDARRALAHLLTRYDVSQKTKEDIAQALIQDNELRFGRLKAGTLTGAGS
jgi:hypothetical protein